MIALHRPAGHLVVVNADLIETVEADEEGATVITLTTGNVLAVAESPEAVREGVVAYRRSIAR
jgi:uncharacterized protein YlzI (FlbEa/FlbD family)